MGGKFYCTNHISSSFLIHQLLFSFVFSFPDFYWNIHMLLFFLLFFKFCLLPFTMIRRLRKEKIYTHMIIVLSWMKGHILTWLREVWLALRFPGCTFDPPPGCSLKLDSYFRLHTFLYVYFPSLTPSVFLETYSWTRSFLLHLNSWNTCGTSLAMCIKISPSLQSFLCTISLPCCTEASNE